MTNDPCIATKGAAAKCYQRTPTVAMRLPDAALAITHDYAEAARLDGLQTS
ncbi:hypothetical protein [Bradyrhizobium sp.]|jgi:hypothetical protein|uniref:hypothetical protein n=1 Tax=Bradyrhizobium sp. TaxID=376 RepID=UPI003C759C07